MTHLLRKLICLNLVFSLLTGCCVFTPPPKPQPKPILDTEHEVTLLHQQIPDLDPNVMRLALRAYNKAQSQGFNQKEILTIIDYSKPSTNHRFWVIDLHRHRIVFSELVAHGKNSGSNYATAFSDRLNSLQSSIGTYVTATTPYQGHFGYALRLQGLEPGFNLQAANRALVVHGAPYVSEQFAKQHGRLGTSWGCPALNPKVVKPVIEQIKGGTVIFAYYPDQLWLNSSRYLNG